jgi:beta-lactamase superfamily II metal-dependent hydrolase
MTVILEALDAKQGDALLLHIDKGGDPALWVIDGGPSGVYASTLSKRLRQIHSERGLADDEPLPIDFVMVTHIDGDHVVGIIDLFKAIRDAQTNQQPQPYRVDRAWHNSFRALVGDDGAVTASLDELQRRDALANRGVAAMVASAGQGAKLADLLRFFHLEGNPPFDGLVAAPKVLSSGFQGAKVTVVGPTSEQLRKLADKWEKEIKTAVDREDLAVIAKYADDTPSNLSSIALYVEVEGKSLFLTGDGRGDHLLDGLRAAGRMDDADKCHVDLLKVPHHGSNRNLEPEFFEKVTADHYVISSNGKDDNPSSDVLEWIVDTQRNRDNYEVHLTYRDANNAHDTLLTALDGSTNCTVSWRHPDDFSISVAL